jgi:hypothetical protein
MGGTFGLVELVLRLQLFAVSDFAGRVLNGAFAFSAML